MSSVGSPANLTFNHSASKNTYINESCGESSLRWKLREEARCRLLKAETEKIPTEEQIDAFHESMKERKSPAISDDTEMIRYDKFRICLSESESELQSFIPSSMFMKLQTSFPDDPYGRIAIDIIMECIRLRRDKMNKIIALNYYDTSGKGVLSIEDMTEYIIEEYLPRTQFPAIDQAGHLQRDYYLNMLLRKIYFFLDPMRYNRIRIVDLAASGLIEEMENAIYEESSRKQSSQDQVTSSSSKSDESINWFSPTNCQKIADLFFQLDKDCNGLLSQSEMSNFRTVTNAFMNRIFDVEHSYEHNQLDLRSFCDILLVMENKGDPVSLAFYFRALDLNGDGYLDACDLRYFYNDLAALYDEMYRDELVFPPPLFADIKDEIFDMCKPKDPLRISLKELIDSGSGGTIVGLLTDLDCLLNYENREDPGQIETDCEEESQQ